MKLENIGRWIDENWREYSLVLITFLYCVVGFLFKIDKKIIWQQIESQTLGWILAILSLAFGIYITNGLIKKKGSVKHLEASLNDKSDKIQVLENEIDELISQQSIFFNILIKTTFYKLKYNANERISIYKYENDKFVLIGRYSSNPELNKVRRKIYSQDQGFLNSAWINEDGRLFIDDLPSFDSASVGYYRKICEVSHIDEEIFQKIRMKSRSYYCKSITSHDDMQRIAVIVFESLTQGKIEPLTIETVLNEHEAILVSLMENVNNTSRNNNMANNLGF